MHGVTIKISKYLYMTAYCPGWVLETSQDNRQSSKQNNQSQLLYPYGVHPDDGLQIGPKYVEIFDEIY
jgi:hypothetical protein